MDLLGKYQAVFGSKEQPDVATSFINETLCLRICDLTSPIFVVLAVEIDDIMKLFSIPRKWRPVLVGVVETCDLLSPIQLDHVLR